MTKEICLVYCPAHEQADRLAKAGAKAAKKQTPRNTVTHSEFDSVNKTLTIKKWNKTYNTQKNRCTKTLSQKLMYHL